MNTATYGQLPQSAADAMSRHLARRDELACDDYLAWFDDMDKIRESCARLVHCEAGDIAFVMNASTGLATLVLGLPWRSGDEMLTLNDEFPNGAGFLYVDRELRQRLPASVVGWRSDRDRRFVDSLNHGEPVFAQTAEKYEGGMLPFPSIYGMGDVIDLILQIGPAAIEARVLELAGKARTMLGGLGAEVNADESQIVTASLPGSDPRELARSLNETDLETLRKALA